ncbi:hypothetical protein TIFTF001_050505, partial [Ficus carica]
RNSGGIRQRARDSEEASSADDCTRLESVPDREPETTPSVPFSRSHSASSVLHRAVSFGLEFTDLLVSSSEIAHHHTSPTKSWWLTIALSSEVRFGRDLGGSSKSLRFRQGRFFR